MSKIEQSRRGRATHGKHKLADVDHDLGTLFGQGGEENLAVAPAGIYLQGAARAGRLQGRLKRLRLVHRHSFVLGASEILGQT